MFTPAQTLYLEEVLGTSAESYRSQVSNQGQGAEPPPPTHLRINLPASPSDAERTLLGKILASVHIEDFELNEGLVTSLEANSPSPHAFVFHGQATGRSVDLEGRVTWNFPALEAMLTNDLSASDLKKQTWALLKQYQKEVSR